MKALLQLVLPLKERMRGPGKQMRNGREDSGAAFQLVSALLAAVLALSHRIAPGPPIENFTVVVSGRFGYQCADRHGAGGSIQPPPCPFAQPSQPAVQG